MDINRIIFNKLIYIDNFESNKYYYEYFEKFKNINKYEIVTKIINLRKKIIEIYTNEIIDKNLYFYYFDLYYLLKEYKNHIDFVDEFMLLMYYDYTNINLKKYAIKNPFNYIFFNDNELWYEVH